MAGPVIPSSMATLHDPAPLKTLRASIGLTPRGPDAMNAGYCSSANPTPPSAVPRQTPIRSRSSRRRSNSPSATAILDAATAELRKLIQPASAFCRRGTALGQSLSLVRRCESQTGTCQSLQLWRLQSGLPAALPRSPSTPIPMGEIMPIPVTADAPLNAFCHSPASFSTIDLITASVRPAMA